VLLAIVIGCKNSDVAKPVLDEANSTANVATNVESSESKNRFTSKGYVGSEACTSCHGDVATSYAKHSMGQSASPVFASHAMPSAEKATFEADGYRYAVKNDGEHWIHHQGRIFGEEEVGSIDLPVSHVIGSGKNGQSYLVDRDGYLFMSPMTWYPAKGMWDLSPGYETNNSQFNRPVIEQCLYCHSDGAHAVQSTSNKFESPVFHAHVIGCERCHGPGETHIAAQEDATKTDSIVNPAKLTPELREAVCQQCHLSGAMRVLKPNKTLHDFQPGNPLSSAYTIFTLHEDGKEFVGHVEQMYQSKCFTKSAGTLGCVSCHDPHSLPSPAEKVQFYRDKCFACHESESCQMESTERLAISAEDNCVVCHMPKLETEIRHAAVTDHSIQRKPSAKKSPSATKKTPLPLLAFPEAFETEVKSDATPRDKAIALLRVAMQKPDVMGDATFGMAISALEESIEKNPTDHEAADALSELYIADQRIDDALNVGLKVLEQEPNREATLLIMAETYSQTGQLQEATNYWERIISVNPWMAKYWYSLGSAYAARQRWQRCQQLAAEGKKRFPTSIGLRHLLVECNLQLGDRKAADAEFEEIVRQSPKKLDSLNRWYENHPMRKTE